MDPIIWPGKSEREYLEVLGTLTPSSAVPSFENLSCNLLVKPPCQLFFNCTVAYPP